MMCLNDSWRVWLWVFGLWVMPVAAQNLPVSEQVEDKALMRLIADVEVADLSRDPVLAGELGDRQALRRLPDVSQAALLDEQAETDNFLARYTVLQAPEMTHPDYYNYQLIGFVLQQRARRAPFDEARIPFTNDSGFFNLMSQLVRRTAFRTAQDYRDYATRLSWLWLYFADNQKNMRRGIATSYLASADILPGIISGVRQLADTPLQEHPFYQPFKAPPDHISAQEWQRLQAMGQSVMIHIVIPAYKDLHRFLVNDYQPRARITPGMGQSQAHRDHYQMLVRYYTTTDLSPDEIHALGLSEVHRIRQEMQVLIDETDFDGTFADFLNFLRSDPQFYANSEQDLLKHAAYITKQIDGQMPDFFGQLPRLPYGVMAVPGEIAPEYTTGRYWSGSLEQGRAGFYVVNSYNLRQRPLYNLPALSAHEAVPGHHHQISLAQEIANAPRFRQNLYIHVFGEGWGLYAEKLAIEMGIYKTPYEHFGRLSYEMWRACRLVVDTGLHWKGFSRAQAEHCFYENTALSAHNIRTEVDRYISWPGQALAYKIGELKILELRARAESALGTAFDIRQFHDMILKDGALPLDMLELKTDHWLEVQKQIQAE